MKEETGNLWDFHKLGYWVCITTNGNVNRNSECVMGKGCALEAKQKFPNLPKKIGRMIDECGNQVYFFEEEKIISFPVKKNWWEKANIKLIEKSCKELVEEIVRLGIHNVYLPRPGCGAGNLQWEDVKPVLEKNLNDRVIVITF